MTVPAGARRPGGVFDRIERGEEIRPVVHAAVERRTPVIEARALDLWYGPTRALHRLDFRVPRGEVTAVIGPSGSGKSSLLRCVNRLNDLVDGARVEGSLRVCGEEVTDRGVDVVELRKRTGMVFQKPNPFPMSVYENTVYPLRVDGERRRHLLEEACERSLRRVGLWEEVKDRLHRSALALSGGQQQRLCIARAIVAEPEVLLLDEPCSALDPVATARIEDLLLELHGAYSILLATHNLQQASRVSDVTAFLVLGRLIEVGPTEEIFLHPKLEDTQDYVTGRFG